MLFPSFHPVSQKHSFLPFPPQSLLYKPVLSVAALCECERTTLVKEVYCLQHGTFRRWFCQI